MIQQARHTMKERLTHSSRFVGSWRMCAQSFVLFCYLTVQILCYTQLNTRLNETLTRLDNLEFLLTEVLSKTHASRDENQLRSNEAERHGMTASEQVRAVNDINQKRYERTRQSDLEAIFSELRQRIDRLQARTNLMPPCNTSQVRHHCVFGPPGPPGRDGRDGKNGLNGLHGRDGRDATPGTPGIPGRAGATGPKGDRGDMGPPGPKIEGAINKEHKRAPRDTRRASREKRTVAARDLGAKASAVYIRWGHRQCRTSTSSTLIYEGRMAGSFHGGGSNYMCAPLDTQFNKFAPRAHRQTRLHGVVYGKVGRLFFNPHMSNSGVPCAVCRAPRASLLMIPALNYCPSATWTREYHGFLMAQDSHNSDSSKTEYVCVDATAQGVKLSNTTRVQARALLTPVRSRCSALPCPPYREDLELTCAVCTS